MVSQFLTDRDCGGRDMKAALRFYFLSYRPVAVLCPLQHSIFICFLI